jgi:hypothetical protein
MKYYLEVRKMTLSFDDETYRTDASGRAERARGGIREAGLD